MKIIGFYFCFLGLFFLLRIRALRKGYKSSEYTKFLDYFEHEYIQTEEKTWRHRYSFIYNSKIYLFLSVLAVIFTELIGIFCLIAGYLLKGGNI